MNESDAARMRVVDRQRIRDVQPNRDKRTPSGRRRYLRVISHHHMMVPACGCSTMSVVGKPGGICHLCDGAVLTGDERLLLH